MSQGNQVLERIAQIQVLIEAEGAPRPNVILAEPYQPTDTNSAACPFFINEAHGGPANIPISAGQQYVTTDIWMILCVRRKEANTNISLSARETLMWRDAVFRAFGQRIRLSNPMDDDVPGQSHVGLSFVVDAIITSWEAPISYVYGSNEYIGLKYVLQVNEMYVTPIEA